MLIDDNAENQNPVETKSVEEKSENENNSGEEIETTKGKEEAEKENNNDHDSIESVSFISQRPKKNPV